MVNIMNNSIGGTATEATKTIAIRETGGVEIYKVCEIHYWQIEQIADMVVKKLKEELLNKL